MRNNQYNPLVLLYGAAVKWIYKTYGRFKEWRFIARERKRFAEAEREMRRVAKDLFG